MSIEEIIKSTGKKKILALDGGGIRGMMAVEVLSVMEAMLEKELGQESFVLSDYFDFICGTSTGAIIATCLSMGMSVEQVRQFYIESGAEMFDKASLLKRYHKYKYEDEALATLLKKVMGEETTLGDKNLRTVLMMVMRNATTDSPWPLSNNPFAKYNDRALTDCNLELPLWQLVRASTAAPVFFPPEKVSIEKGNNKKDFIFVDGGITPYNNPAFQAFLMATVDQYKMNWQTGEENMLIVSVGTGTSPEANAHLAEDDMNIVYNASKIPSALMFASLNEQDFLCRVFGRCKSGAILDGEVGNMIDSTGPLKEKMFSYVRYNAELTRKGLNDLGLQDINPENVQKLDSVEYIEELQRVGVAVAERQLKLNQFDGFL